MKHYNHIRQLIYHHASEEYVLAPDQAVHCWSFNSLTKLQYIKMLSLDYVIQDKELVCRNISNVNLERFKAVADLKHTDTLNLEDRVFLNISENHVMRGDCSLKTRVLGNQLGFGLCNRPFEPVSINDVYHWLDGDFHALSMQYPKFWVRTGNEEDTRWNLPVEEDCDYFKEIKIPSFMYNHYDYADITEFPIMLRDAYSYYEGEDVYITYSGSLQKNGEAQKISQKQAFFLNYQIMSTPFEVAYDDTLDSKQAFLHDQIMTGNFDCLSS
jgi:hypothetical protein